MITNNYLHKKSKIMKAEELVKKERTIESLYKDIESANERGDYRLPCSPWTYISNDTVVRLVEDGFKCRYVKDPFGLECLIIEW